MPPKPLMPGDESRKLPQFRLFEMPEPKIVVTEHRAMRLCCPGCGKETQAPFPQEVVHPVQYGANLLGFATCLHSVHLLPFARCARILRDVTGAPFSAGSLSRALSTAWERLAPFEGQLDAALRQANHQHADETGSRVAGKLHWIHVRCTKTLCRLFLHEKRGSEAVMDLFCYKGCLMSDFYNGWLAPTSSVVPITRNGSAIHAFCGS